MALRSDESWRLWGAKYGWEFSHTASLGAEAVFRERSGMAPFVVNLAGAEAINRAVVDAAESTRSELSWEDRS